MPQIHLLLAHEDLKNVVTVVERSIILHVLLSV